MRGLLGQAHQGTNAMFHEIFGNPVYSATMSRNRFKFLIARISFDDHTSCFTRCQAGMWKRLFFKRFHFHIYRFRFPQQKTKKRPLTTFLNFCGFVAFLLLHFIILRKQKPSFTAITLPTSLEDIVSNYSMFVLLRYQNSC